MTITDDIDVWKENITKLKAYRRKYGDYNVPFNWKEDKQLSRWVENIRRHPSQVPIKLYKELYRIGFDFNIHLDWNTMFSKLEAFYEKHGDSYVPPFQREYENLFDWTVNQRGSKGFLTQAQIKKLNAINFEWETLSDKDLRWQGKYKELVEFKGKYGHIKVPQYFKDNKGLGDWVSKQRRSKTEGKLLKERIRQLNRLGFLWKEDIAGMREEAWEARYKELVLYKKINKHIDRIQIKKENYQLGLWLDTQIVHQDRMSPYRMKKLNAIDFKWDKGDIYEERWNEMYERLKSYKAIHGHCRVSQREDFKLSVWLQRNKRDRKIIGNEKRIKLEQMGVKWPNELFKEIWKYKFEELKAFKKEHGHLRIPRSNRKLYEWVQTQKKNKEDGTLTSEREEKLSKLGFIWKGEFDKQRMKAWENMFEKFRTLKNKYPLKYHIKLRENPGLDEWVRLQIHNKEKLSTIKKKKLKIIGFLWNSHYRDERWEEKYNQLLAYKKKYGNCDVPQQFPENQALATWVNVQRAKKLLPYKKNKLNKIEFSWANELVEKRWLQRLKEFNDFKKINKHLKIPHHTPLYSWVYQQRKHFNKLSAEKKKMLIKAGLIEGTSRIHSVL